MYYEEDSMLTENDVVRFVSAYLQKNGYVINHALTTKQRGIDIEATHQERGRCFVEAKGATSSIKGSRRYGLEFNKSQIKTHIGVALLQSFQTLQQNESPEVIIALPNNADHRAVIDSIRTPIKNAGIYVYLVNDSGSIEQYI